MKLIPSLLLAASLVTAAEQSNVVVDNDQVKVIKVLQQPHEKTRLHEHTVNRVMIYLTPGKQNFSWEDGHKTVLTWKANEAKWSPAGGKHIAEITSDNPVTIVELELKKPGAPRGATPLDPVKVDPKDYKVDFENDQVRVVRVKLGPHQKTPMHEHVGNRVVVFLADSKTRVTTADGKSTVVEHKLGDSSWNGPAKHQEENLLDTPFEVYAVELKN